MTVQVSTMLRDIVRRVTHNDLRVLSLHQGGSHQDQAVFSSYSGMTVFYSLGRQGRISNRILSFGYETLNVRSGEVVLHFDFFIDKCSSYRVRDLTIFSNVASILGRLQVGEAHQFIWDFRSFEHREEKQGFIG